MESIKIEAKRIQLDMLKEDAKALEKVLEAKLSNFVNEEETRNNARKMEAIKQMNITLKTLSYRDQQIMEKLRKECINLTDTNNALKDKIERLNIHDNINEDINDIKSELETMNEAAKGLAIEVEVDRGMMTTARNKFTDAIFMKTSRLDPHSFSMEFEEYNGEATTCNADYFEIQIKSNNKKQN